MKKRKISNWEHLLKMMVGSWFEYNEHRQRIISFEVRSNSIEVKTSAHTYNFDHDEIKTKLHEWKPIECNGVPPLIILEHAEYEGEAPVETGLITTLKPDDNINDALIVELLTTQARHKNINKKFTAAIDKIMDEIDRPAALSAHLIKKAEILSQFSKDNINTQLTELKDLAMLQKAIELKNSSPAPGPKVIEEKNKPDEKSNNNTED